MTSASNVYLIWLYIIVTCGGPFIGYLNGIDKVLLYQAFEDFIAFSMTSASNVYLIWPYIIVTCGGPIISYLNGIDKVFLY